MPNIRDVVNKPGFSSLSREQQIKALGKIDPDGFGLMKPSQQNKALDGIMAATTSDVQEMPSAEEEKGFFGKFTDRFAPTAILKNLPDLASSGFEKLMETTHNVDKTMKEDPLKAFADIFSAGPRVLGNMAKSTIDSTMKDVAPAYEDYKNADSEIDRILAAADAVGSLPIIGSMRKAGNDLFPRNPSESIDPSALGSFGGEIAN